MEEKMTQQQKDVCAKSQLEISLSYSQIAEKRTSELADEFSRLEVQIATILFAFSGFFFDFFKDEKFKSFSQLLQFGIKITFGICLFFLIGSLAVGLLHIKRKEKFWDEVTSQRIIRFQKWRDTIQGVGTFEEAQAFHNGVGLQKGHMISVPKWPWILQTICLGLAISILFVVFLVVLFR